MIKKIIVAEEAALAEFERWAEEMDLDFDVSNMDDEDRDSFNRAKARLVKAIMHGHLIVNDDGEMVYTPHRKSSRSNDPLTFHERTGASLMAADGKNKGDTARTYAVMGDMCKCHPNVFAGLAGADIKVCETIFALMMD